MILVLPLFVIAFSMVAFSVIIHAIKVLVDEKRELKKKMSQEVPEILYYGNTKN